MPEQTQRPLEFKIENKDVYFIEGTMPGFIHYGRLFTAIPTSTENQFEIKKFDLGQQQYLHTNELSAFEISGHIVEVVEGFATALPQEPEPEAIPEPGNSELMAKLSEQEESALNRDELLLEQQLLLLNIDLNTSL